LIFELITPITYNPLPMTDRIFTFIFELWAFSLEH
jgi:hypothetical protein